MKAALHTRLCLTLLVFACALTARADPNSAERVHAFARLSNWPGIWESTVWLADESGRPPGGSAKVRADAQLLRTPPYNNEWAAMGNPGWSFADVLPYFKRTERAIGIGSDDVRGRDGPIPVTEHDNPDALSEAFMDSLADVGISRTPDYNGMEQEGTAYFQRFISGRRRVSAADGYLHPAKGRSNLEVRTHAQATRIVKENGRATGVEYVDDRDKSQRVTIRANKEVIVCAGALNSAKLLQLSGIGPAPVLQALGIQVQRALAGVGEGLRDHYAVRMVAAVKNVGTLNERAHGLRLAGEVTKYCRHTNGRSA